MVSASPRDAMSQVQVVIPKERIRQAEPGEPERPNFSWGIRAEHTDAILLAVGDSLDLVLLRYRCGLPVGRGMKGCFAASTIRVPARWTLDDPGLADARPLPSGHWRFGAGTAGARLYAKAPGTTKVNALEGERWLVNASVQIISAPGAVRVRLESTSDTIALGDTIRVRVTARDARDRIVAVLPFPEGYTNNRGPTDSLGFTPMVFKIWGPGWRIAARLGRMTDTLALAFKQPGNPSPR
jgi:hypothetical protein